MGRHVEGWLGVEMDGDGWGGDFDGRGGMVRDGERWGGDVEGW